MTFEEAKAVFVEKQNRMNQLGAQDAVVDAMLAIIAEIERVRDKDEPHVVDLGIIG